MTHHNTPTRATETRAAEFAGSSLAQLQDGLQQKLAAAATDDELREKRRWGRLQKAKGDVALLAGSPRDALEHYRSGLELSKAAGDAVWAAAALEGLAHARVADTLAGGSGGGGGGGEGSPTRRAALASSAAAAGPGGAGAAAAGAAEDTPSEGSPRRAPVGGGPSPSEASADDGFGPPPPVNAAMWALLRAAPGLDGEVGDLMAEARAWLRRRGGALALQVESALQHARFLAGVRGARAARPEGLDLLGAALEAVPQLPLLEDRLVALVEAAQVMGLLGCGRKRQLLLWAAVDLSRAVDRSDTLAMRIATRALEPPDAPDAQDPDDLPRCHWARRRAALPLFDPSRCPGAPWEAVRLAAAEAALAAARTANSPIEAWEAAALILREHGPALPPAHQAAVLEALAQAAARFPQRALSRGGPGPAPLAMVRRVAPPPPALAPVRLAGSAGGRRGGGGAGGGAGGGGGDAGPFIFNPYAARRARGNAAAAAQAAAVEWAAGDEGRVEVVLANPLAVPLRLDGVALAVEAAAVEGDDGEGAQEGGSTTGGGRGSAQGSPAKQQQQQQQQPEQQPEHHHHHQQPRQSSGGGAGDAADHAAALAAQGPAIAPTVAIMLPAGGKPVRVSLPLTPTRPGELRVRGVLVTAWGVTWEQPLTLLPRLAPLTAPGALRPQPPQRVRVLPRLPLLRATLAGPDVQLTVPSEAECGGGGGGTKAQTGSGSGGGAGGGGVTSPTAAAAAAAAAAASLGAKATLVPVCEGQHLAWSLTLTNAGDLAVGACGLAVVNARGQPLRGPPSQLPASFAGVHVDAAAAEAQLRAALPLAPRRSVTLPLSLAVGRPPADAFEGVELELRVTYAPGGGAEAAGVGGLESPGADGGAGQNQQPLSPPASPTSPLSALPEGTVGRRLALRLRFAVQPTLAVADARFLRLAVPLRDGRRCGGPALAGLEGGGGGGGGGGGEPHRTLSTARSLGGGGIVRNSSEGALLSPTAKGAHAWQQMHRHSLLAEQAAGAQPPSPSSPAKRGSAAAAFAAAEAAAASGARRLGLASEAVLELRVRNRSERYFRAWLARLPGSAGADGAESAVAVLEPGDDARLLCPLLPPAASDADLHTPAPPPAPAEELGPRDAPERMRCAERLAEAVGLRWEMITGDAAPDRLPRGLVRLAPVTVARSLTPAALAALAPSRLHARVVAVADDDDESGGDSGGTCGLELVDATAAAQALGARAPGHIGPLWAVRAAVGRPLALEVRLANAAHDRDEAVALSVAVSDLAAAAAAASAVAAAGEGAGTANAAPSDGAAALASADSGSGGDAPGLLLTGCFERAALVAPAGGAAPPLRLSSLPLRAGLFEVGVRRVEAAATAAAEAAAPDGGGGGIRPGLDGGGGASGDGEAAAALYVTQDRLRVLVEW